MKRTISITVAIAAGSISLWTCRAWAAAQPSTSPTSDHAPATQPATRPSQAAVLAANTLARLDLPYVEKAGPKQTLDLYAPKDAKAAPIVVYIHGGEWAKGDKADVSYKPRFLNEHGIVFVSVNYRLSTTDKHPAQVNDIAAALGWVKRHANEFGGDPAKVVLVGHSAGCHLVTLVGLDPRPLATAGLKPGDLLGVMSWSGGAFDLVDKVKGGGMYAKYIHDNFGDAEADWHDASPIAHIGDAKPIPPFLFVSAGDGNADSKKISDEMAARIGAAGGKAQSIVLPGKTHFTSDQELGQPGDKTGDILLDFIRDAAGSKQ